MRVGLIVHRVTLDRRKNLDAILSMAEEAAISGAELILFSEAALTGLINNDNPANDLPLGESIPGPVTKALGSVCRKHRVWLAIGLLERENNRLYDSAVLIDQGGRISLKYRRNQPQWHGKKADPSVYSQGSDMGTTNTPVGTTAFLICGDLFDDNILSRLGRLKPDCLLFPFARCFPDGSADQHRWDAEELPEYIARVKMIGAPALMVNYLAGSHLADGNSFGGAFVVSAQGQVIASHPLGREGILLADVDGASNKRNPRAA